MTYRQLRKLWRDRETKRGRDKERERDREIKKRDGEIKKEA